MSWTFNNIRIYTQGFENNTSAIIARLQPVGTGTVYQYFGYEYPTLSLRGLVATTSGANILRDMVQSESSYTLSGPEGNIGNFFVKDVKVDRQQSYYLTLFDQPELDSNTPFYMISLSLYEDV